MDIDGITAQLKTILDTKTGSGASDLFSVAYDYPEAVPESFPAVRVFFLGGGTQEIMEYNSVWQTGDWIVEAFFEYVSGKTEYDNVISILESLLVELNRQSHYTLSGNAEYVLAEDHEMIYPTEMDTKKYMGFRILVQVKKLQNTTA